MDEYISREALIDHVMAYGRPISRCVVTEQRGVRFEIENWVCDGKVYFVVKANGKVAECMEMSAKDDVVEVVHGEWIIKTDYKTPLSHAYIRKEKLYICPYCAKTYRKQMNFCGNCGAIMDGKRKDGVGE